MDPVFCAEEASPSFNTNTAAESMKNTATMNTENQSVANTGNTGTADIMSSTGNSNLFRHPAVQETINKVTSHPAFATILTLTLIFSRQQLASLRNIPISNVMMWRVVGSNFGLSSGLVVAGAAADSLVNETNPGFGRSLVTGSERPNGVQKILNAEHVNLPASARPSSIVVREDLLAKFRAGNEADTTANNTAANSNVDTTANNTAANSNVATTANSTVTASCITFSIACPLEAGEEQTTTFLDSILTFFC